jgi:hypothetical protein
MISCQQTNEWLTYGAFGGGIMILGGGAMKPLARRFYGGDSPTALLLRKADGFFSHRIGTGG